ncbi:hypothetical protein DFH11DRAFT_1573289 [Phellopilus nigrolimitatus]|nr:hypothetical protein DFH11DRAFT_1573289 [Phellopilus nigrolimitatus]
MTLLVPLDRTAQCSSWPAFVSPVDDPATFSAKVVKTILKAKRVAVVCGAGISVQAGIPDFRSADENPREVLTSGKDLFDASVFNAESTTALFCQMMARLSRISTDAIPTPFHNLLRELDDRGKLLRVYTQNIDALEEKAGMTFGLPDHNSGRAKGKSKAKGAVFQTIEDANLSEGSNSVGVSTRDASLDSTPVENSIDVLPQASSSSSRETPRCIPLHGTLQTMHCVSCTHTFPLSDHLASLLEGVPPDCPECEALEATRSLVGKRPRGVGKLRPSVVLYNEDHRDGEDVGAIVRRDITGSSKGKGRSGADVLVVVGTSLRVPGTKRIVREFSKAVKARESARAEKAHQVALAKLTALSTPAETPTPMVSPTPSPRRSPAADDEVASSSETPPEMRPITTIYVNLDFPVPTREWDGVFDVWIQGDAQVFAGMIRDEMEREEKEKTEKLERDERAKEERREREEKKRIDKEAKDMEKAEREKVIVGMSKKQMAKGKKRSAPTIEVVPPTKRRRVTLIVHDPSADHSPIPPSPTSPPKRSFAKSVKTSKSKETVASSVVTPSVKTKTVAVSPNFRNRSSTTLGSQSPHAMRARIVPEIATTVPPSLSSSNSSSSSTVEKQRSSNSKQRLEAVSPLDMLANTAASMSRVRLNSPPLSPKEGGRKRKHSLRHIYDDEGELSFLSPSPCPCPYPISLNCDCCARFHSRTSSQSLSQSVQTEDRQSSYPASYTASLSLSRASTLTPLSSPVLSATVAPTRIPQKVVDDLPLTPQSLPKRVTRRPRNDMHLRGDEKAPTDFAEDDDVAPTPIAPSKRQKVRGRAHVSSVRKGNSQGKRMAWAPDAEQSPSSQRDKRYVDPADNYLIDSNDVDRPPSINSDIKRRRGRPAGSGAKSGVGDSSRSAIARRLTVLDVSHTVELANLSSASPQGQYGVRGRWS